jgi:hypothetical protein
MGQYAPNSLNDALRFVMIWLTKYKKNTPKHFKIEGGSVSAVLTDCKLRFLYYSHWLLLRKGGSVCSGISTFFKNMMFTKADKVWLDFVYSNRKAIKSKQYDIVFGPVANDRLFATITLYEQGILTAEAAIEQLKSYLLFDQISFNSQKVIDFLKYNGSI